MPLSSSAVRIEYLHLRGAPFILDSPLELGRDTRSGSIGTCATYFLRNSRSDANKTGFREIILSQVTEYCLEFELGGC